MSTSVTSTRALSSQEMVTDLLVKVSELRGKTFVLTECRSILETNPQAMTPYLVALERENLLFQAQMRSLAGRIDKTSSEVFSSWQELGRACEEVSSRLFFGRFCLELLDPYKGFNREVEEYENNLKRWRALKENPFGVGDVMDRIIGFMQRIGCALCLAQSTSIERKIQFTDFQGRSLETVRRKWIDLHRSIIEKGISFGDDCRVPDPFYHYLEIAEVLDLIKKGVEDPASDLLGELGSRIGKLPLPFRSAIAERAEGPSSEKEILVYKRAVEQSIEALSEYRPRCTDLWSDGSSGSAGHK